MLKLLSDKRLIAVCNTLTPELLGGIARVNRDARVQTERRDRLLMHLFQHQIHHRGQAHAMLSGTAIKPPQLDEFFPIAEAPLRAIEFDQSGLDRRHRVGTMTSSRTVDEFRP